MNLTANEKCRRCPTKTICSAVGGYAGTFVYHYSTFILGGYYPLTPVQVLNAFLSKFGFKGDILPGSYYILKYLFALYSVCFIYWCFLLGSR